MLRHTSWLPPPATRPPHLHLSSTTIIRATAIALTSEEGRGRGSGGALTAKERRQLRNERRQSSNWKEEVEEKLLVKPKKRYASWTEELNLDNLALLGPQWWVVRVSRVNGHETADRLVRAFVRVYPEMDFKVYIPAVRVKRKLKNGSDSIKSKPLFPGCVFLHCVLNKEIHDFVRECTGVGGFLGSRVGNTKRQINRPKSVDAGEMDAIFKKAKEEQENLDHEFEKEQQQNKNTSGDSGVESSASGKSKSGTRPRQTRRNSGPSESSLSKGEDDKLLVPGSNVHVLSGPFAEYMGSLKEINRKTGKATIGFMLFGKESFVDLEVDQIVAAETS